MKKLLLLITIGALALSACTRLEERLEYIGDGSETEIDGVLYERTSFQLKDWIADHKINDSIGVSLYSSNNRLGNGILIRKGDILFHLLHPTTADISEGSFSLIHNRKGNERRRFFKINMTVSRGSITAMSLDTNIYKKYFDIKPGVSDGTKAHPFTIDSACDGKNTMRSLADAIVDDCNNGEGVYFKMTGNINFESDDYDNTKALVGYVPNSESGVPFRGHFNGGGAKIENYYVSNLDYEGVGLFHRLGDGAEITDVKFSNASISSQQKYTGVLAGYIDDNATVIIRGVRVQGSTVYGADYVGGLIGKVSGTLDMDRCCVEKTSNILVHPLINKESVSNMGGLIGGITSTTGESSINYSYIDKQVTLIGGKYVGGIVGIINIATPIVLDSCYNYSNSITASGENCGGLIGYSYLCSGARLTITKSGTDTDPVQYTGVQLSGPSVVGGVIGRCTVLSGATLSMNDVWAMGNHSCTGSYYGGIAGILEGGGTISFDNVRHQANGVVSAAGVIGGLVGWVSDAPYVTMLNSYNLSSIQLGLDNTGGLIGRASGSAIHIENSYNSGFIGGGSHVGGIIADCANSTISIYRCCGVGSLDDKTDDTIIFGSSGGSCVGGMVGYISGGTLEISGGGGDNHDIVARGHVGSGNSKSDNVGGVVGHVTNCYLTIESAKVCASVTGANNIGGFVGLAQTDDQSWTKLKYLQFSTTEGIIGGDNVGGIAGNISGFNPELYSLEVTEGTKVIAETGHGGGIVGFFESTDNLYTPISGCTNRGSVSSPVDAGGIVGRLERAKTTADGGFGINYCYNYGSVSGQKTVGGIIGFVAGGDYDQDLLLDQLINYGPISNVESETYANEDVKVGGLIGWVKESVNIQYSSNRGPVTTTKARYTGGLVGCIGQDAGNFPCKIIYCFNSGNICGKNDAYHQGGIVGAINDVPLEGSGIYDCYNTGDITGQQTAGIASYLGYGGDIHRCFHIGTGTHCGILKGHESSNHYQGNFTNVSDDESAGNSVTKYLSNSGFTTQSEFTDEGYVFGDFGWEMGLDHPLIHYHKP